MTATVRLDRVRTIGLGDALDRIREIAAEQDNVDDQKILRWAADALEGKDR